MPQISQLAETYASQIFWALIFFGLVFFVIGRGFIPGVLATVATRDQQIAGDLAAAEAARRASDEAEASWKATAAQQRADAQSLIAKAKGEAAVATDASLAAAAVTIDARVHAADASIAAARAAALTEIETVASEAASDIVARLAGLTVEPEAARAAVKEALHG